jgi:tRNA modification GTPase
VRIKHGLDDTITAISTPIGRGAIGIVRLSGKDALSIADRIFVSKARKKPSTYKTYTVHYGWIVSSPQKNDKKLSVLPHPCLAGRQALSANIIDEVLLTVMRAPKSYTKEDIVEISCHSGILVLREILDLVLANGARIACPGEFTKRAFLNGRIDLCKAEAVMDIINAKTRLALESGVKQLEGFLADEVRKIREQLLEIIAVLEANIDFPEEEIGPADKPEGDGGQPNSRSHKKAVKKNITEAAERINNLLDSARHGKILREGIAAVIVGRANAGKSSLLNALLKEERAIVTPIAGTTRDAIEEILDLKGIPLKIADTAGIIEPRDLIEKEALRRTQNYFEKAELVLLVFDSSARLTREDRQLIAKAKSKTTIAVLNKSDLKTKIEEAQIKKYFSSIVRISCLRQGGLKELEEKIIQSVWRGEVGAAQELVVTNSRHIQAFKNARDVLGRAGDSLKSNLSIEFIAEDLKLCREHLGYILGEAVEKDILDKIFSEFCIGK